MLLRLLPTCCGRRRASLLPRHATAVAQLRSEKAVAEAYAGELKTALEKAYEYIEQLEEERCVFTGLMSGCIFRAKESAFTDQEGGMMSSETRVKSTRGVRAPHHM